MNFVNNASEIMLDIDGTIKDLVKENTNALIYTMKIMNRVDLKLRGKFVLWINKINMYLVKTGFLPTNGLMQRILLLFYSILLLKKYNKFRNIYFDEYNKKDIFFDCVDKKMKELYANRKSLYLVTKNIQNENILKYESLNMISRLVVETKKRIKYYTYRDLIEELDVAKENIIIVGDNFWDDVLPALILDLNVIWCNMYNCNLKKIAIKILGSICRKISYCNSIKEI